VTRRLSIRPQAEIDVTDAIAWYEEQWTGLAELFNELDSIMERGSVFFHRSLTPSAPTRAVLWFADDQHGK
jgi:hypothetical protein